MPDRNEESKRSPLQDVRALYEDAESRTAKAFEEAVSKPSFGTLLAHSAENVVALTRIGGDLADLVLRNLRIAGRADITRLARQLHRNEDKLERVLQEVEQLRDELGRTASRAASRSSASSRSSGSSASGNGGNGRSSSGTRRRSSSSKS
jgi:uncharacterized membrane protein YgcG